MKGKVNHPLLPVRLLLVLHLFLFLEPFAYIERVNGCVGVMPSDILSFILPLCSADVYLIYFHLSDN